MAAGVHPDTDLAERWDCPVARVQDPREPRTSDITPALERRSMSQTTSMEPTRSILFTDLYELTMAQAYEEEGMHQLAVFELFFRKMPKNRNYLMAAGLEDVLAYLESFRLFPEDLAYLRGLGNFSDSFLDRLAKTKFTGEVWAAPEGTIVFPHEPLLQIVAPIFEAQLVETFVLNQIHFQSVAATKASRVVLAAKGRMVIDFGARRAHGVDAALKVARASYLAGAAGSSLVIAGRMYGVPAFGTMAHSYIQAHDDELASFEAFTRLYPATTLLVDTYDTLHGVEKVIELRRRLGDAFHVKAVRLDSGDLGDLARQARKLLDNAGLREVKIFASSGLDEYKIRELVEQGAPIDAFGVGTKMAVAEDAPSLDMAYKLVEYAGEPRSKFSLDKVIFPGRKQVFREHENARMTRDVLARFDEGLGGQPLLRPVMHAGRRLDAGRVSLEEARNHAREELNRLPDRLRVLETASEPHPVIPSDRLRKEHDQVREKLRETQLRKGGIAP
jgi:nicotinate phosphoribosyltransferase